MSKLPKIDIDPSAPLDADGQRKFEQYKAEIAGLTAGEVALLLTHMHVATEKLIAVIRDQERKIEIATAIKKVCRN